MRMMRFFYSCCALYFLAIFAVSADTFPSKPIRVIVPYAAGGTADFMVRLMARALRFLIIR